MAVFLRKKGKIKKVSDGRRPSVCWPPGNDAILPVTTETTMETVYRGPRPTPPTDTDQPTERPTRAQLVHSAAAKPRTRPQTHVTCSR